MTKNCLGLILLLFGSIHLCMGQNIESLLKDLKTLESNKIESKKGSIYSNDTLRTILLVKIANQYRMDGDYPKSEEYGMNALAFAKNISYKKGEINAQEALGNLFNEQGKYTDAIAHYSETIKLNESLGNKKEIANTESKIAVIYFDQKNDDEALKYFQLSLKISDEIGDKILMAGCYGNIGRIYKVKGDYAEALKSFQASLKIAEEAKVQGGLSTVYKNIGQVSNEQGRFQEGLKKQINNLKEELDYQEKLTAEQLIEHKQKLQLKEKELALTNKEKDIEKFNNQINQAELEQQRILNENLQITNDKNKIALELEKANAKSKEVQRNLFIAGSFLMLLVSFLILRNYLNQKKSNRLITKEKNRSDELLLNILPYGVAEELKNTGTAKAKNFDMVTVMFTDFKDFTTISERLSPEKLVAEIHYCFSSFDEIIHKHGIEKIKTIGDAYMCAGGLPETNATHAADVVNAGIEIRDFINNYNKEKKAKGEDPFEIRIGINSGPVVAGIVGLKKFAYDIWGDTVNLANRMESSGEPGKVNISGATYSLVKDQFICEHRGKISAKNKGEVDMYFVENR